MSRSELVIGKDFGKLKEKTVVVIGVGGTGCAVVQLLSKINLKKLIIMDGDYIEESNLERQFLYSSKDIGKRKVDVVVEKLDAVCSIDAIPNFATAENIPLADLIIDCTDNAESRLAIDSFCRSKNIPWIYTGAVGAIGAVYFVHPTSKPVDVFIKDGESCCAVGVLNSLVSIVGSWAVSIAITYLTTGKYEDKLIRFNLNQNEVWKLSI